MLNNTVYRLRKEKKLTVGYFGGSITEGAGATSWDHTSWRGLINKHLKETYPDVEFKEVMAAIGGTGTDFGLCRCQHDLLSGKPDLVFIEFAVNDSGLELTEQMPCYENCLRQILSYDDTVDIICVFTITKALEKKLLETGAFSSRSIQSTLAHHYGLPTVDLGEHIRIAVANAGGDWLKYTTDETHPNDDGYIVYTNVMKKALARLLDGETPEALIHHEIPRQLSHETLVNGRMIELSECEDTLSGFTFINKPFKRRFPHYYKANGIGSTIDYTFEGTGFGLYWLMDNNSGCISVTLDSKETKVLSAWDDYCKSFSRAGYVFPFKNLENTKHTVHIRVIDEKNPESKGNDIAIYAFLLV
ncbi:MAG: SGNH/GDSL hydrolase family protein [Clostridia bacterium]|nr:SGNH/GDSL hydrolase family protein [Clostridia bacterium]